MMASFRILLVLFLLLVVIAETADIVEPTGAQKMFEQQKPGTSTKRTTSSYLSDGLLDCAAEWLEILMAAIVPINNIGIFGCIFFVAISGYVKQIKKALNQESIAPCPRGHIHPVTGIQRSCEVVHDEASMKAVWNCACATNVGNEIGCNVDRKQNGFTIGSFGQKNCETRVDNSSDTDHTETMKRMDTKERRRPRRLRRRKRKTDVPFTIDPSCVDPKIGTSVDPCFPPSANTIGTSVDGPDVPRLETKASATQTMSVKDCEQGTNVDFARYIPVMRPVPAAYYKQKALLDWVEDASRRTAMNLPEELCTASLLPDRWTTQFALVVSSAVIAGLCVARLH
ncbi:unnamed protein product [Owenia fusiformis]|uniref:Uncharacterized protein n=1 Tax=Owenia fusiformis TaxID=6347 RepID=A0A8J1T8B9_OWEFU|nr:unnamed protein product [Owenia fusiformis]